MRVVVWGINYAPEQTGIGPYNTALCEFLAQRGHEVEMVTAFEYYPAWEKRAEDRGRVYRDERRAGVGVHRCWLYVPGNVRALKRIGHELSFVVSSLARILFLKRAEVYVTISPPLLLGVAVALVKAIKRAPVVFHVQDLQPDAAIQLGMLKADGWLTRMLFGIEAIAYRSADRVSSISRGILENMKAKGVPSRKLLAFPNGVRFPANLPAKGEFRQRHGISATSFIVLYSGNLGMKQGLGVLVDAARLLLQRPGGAATEGRREVKFVIAGAGAFASQFREQVERENLENVLLLPLQPEQAYHEMLVDADCCAITQQPGTGALFFPSKLLTALAFAKPVLSIADEHSDLARAVQEGAFGVNVAAGSAAGLVEALDRWLSPTADLETLGQNGCRYVGRFEMNHVLADFEAELLRLVASAEVSDAVGSPDREAKI